MQRVGRVAAASLLQFQRLLAADAGAVVQQAQQSAIPLNQWRTASHQAAAAAGLQQSQRGCQQVQQQQPMASDGCSCSQQTAGLWPQSHQQQQELLQLRHHSTLVPGLHHITSSSSGNSHQASRHPFSTSVGLLAPSSLQRSSSSSSSSPATPFSPMHMTTSTAASASGSQATQQQGGGVQAAAAAAAAAAAKPIVGVCRRRRIKCGWKKIDFVLRMIRRTTVDDAMAQLIANPKRAAMFVRHAIANARNNAIFAGGDPQRLYVAEAYVTRGDRYVKRHNFMGRGYHSIKETQFSHLNVRVQQMDAQAAAAVALRRSPRLVAPIMHRMLDRQRRTPRAAFVKGGDVGQRQVAATA